MPSQLRLGFCVLLAVVTLGVSPSARADIPPPDACNEVGARCLNAGDMGRETGRCVAATCTKQLGGSGKSYTYECKQCVADGVAAPRPSALPAATPAPSSSPATAASSPVTSAPRSGCAVAVSHPARGRELTLAVCVAAVLVARRRRRS